MGFISSHLIIYEWHFKAMVVFQHPFPARTNKFGAWQTHFPPVTRERRLRHYINMYARKSEHYRALRRWKGKDDLQQAASPFPPFSCTPTTECRLGIKILFHYHLFGGDGAFKILFAGAFPNLIFIQKSCRRRRSDLLWLPWAFAG